MRHHSFDEWLREFADPRRSRAKFPEFIDLLRRFATLEVTPEMILNCRFSRASSLAHKNYGSLVASEFEWSTRVHAASVVESTIRIRTPEDYRNFYGLETMSARSGCSVSFMA